MRGKLETIEPQATEAQMLMHFSGVLKCVVGVLSHAGRKRKYAATARSQSCFESWIKQDTGSLDLPCVEVAKQPAMDHAHPICRGNFMHVWRNGNEQNCFPSSLSAGLGHRPNCHAGHRGLP